MRRVAVATLVLSAVALLAFVQAQTDVSGRVVSDETGDPLPNARVALTTSLFGSPVVLTDRDGRFHFAAAPSERTGVAASKTGYARHDVALSPGGQPIEIRLQRSAAISGQVLDEFGDPVFAARVAAEIAPRGTNLTIAANTETDDRGEYRLAGLPAGSFVVAVVTMGAMASQAVGPTDIRFGPAPRKSYYPGVDASAEAQALRLQAGEDRRAINFVVSASNSAGQPFSVQAGPLDRPPTPSSARRPVGILRGRVAGTDGRAVPHAQVRLSLQKDPRQALVDRKSVV